MELFEDNPADFIRGDIEGNNTDTRRRCATSTQSCYTSDSLVASCVAALVCIVHRFTLRHPSRIAAASCACCRVATDLIRSLCRNFNAAVTPVAIEYVNRMIAEYEADKKVSCPAAITIAVVVWHESGNSLRAAFLLPSAPVSFACAH